MHYPWTSALRPMARSSFSDAAQTSIFDGSHPYFGYYKPAISFSNFAGLSNSIPSGYWTLKVHDNHPQDQGWVRSPTAQML